MNLDHQPVSFFSNFRPKPKETLNTCSKARYFLHAFSKLWVQLLVNETHGNSRRHPFKIPVKQSSPLSSNTVELSETKLNESFPRNCQNIPLGLVIYAFHYRGKLVEIHYRHVIKEFATVTPIPSFYIKLSSTPTIKPLKKELSRFWLQHTLNECPDQFCWRDILDLTSLPTNRALLLVIGVAWILAGILLYTNPALNTSWIC